MIADLQSIRNTAIDEAIAVCETEETHVRSLGLYMSVAACGTIADKLRGLKHTEPMPASDQGNARDELVKALQCAQKLLDKDIAYVGATAVLPFESHGQAISHVGEARRVIAATLAKAGAADAIQAKKLPRFENVACSQCGGSFGPGEHGFSHCENHHGMCRTSTSVHTATPKELPLESVMRRHCDSLVVEIRAEDGMQVLRFPERHRALAAYIVRACNAHDALAKAVQAEFALVCMPIREGEELSKQIGWNGKEDRNIFCRRLRYAAIAALAKYRDSVKA